MWGTLSKIRIRCVFTKCHCWNSQNELEPCILWQSNMGEHSEVSYIYSFKKCLVFKQSRKMLNTQFFISLEITTANILVKCILFTALLGSHVWDWYVKIVVTFLKVATTLCVGHVCLLLIFLHIQFPLGICRLLVPGTIRVPESTGAHRPYLKRHSSISLSQVINRYSLSKNISIK